MKHQKKYKVYKADGKTWIVLSKIPLRYIGAFESIRIAKEVCKFYNDRLKFKSREEK